MRIAHVLPLAGVSYLALASVLLAQAADQPAVTVLDPITLVVNGQENVEATGGAVVTAEDIEALQPADVSELFARESAVTVSGGAGPSKRIHVFGIEQSKLAVSVDGVPQSVTSWHHTGSNVIDPAFLKSVEVEAGAAAADTGFAAAAGAVRFETVGAHDLLQDGRTMGGRAALSYGSNGRGASGSLAGYGVHKGFDWFVMVYGASGKDYKSGAGTVVPGTEPASRGLLAKLGYEVENHRFELNYERSEDEADRVIKMNMDLNHDPAVYPLRVTRDTLSFKYTTTAPTDLWDPELQLYISDNGYWRPNYAPGRTNGDMDLDARSRGGVIKNRFTLGPGTITAGIDFARKDFRVDNYGDAATALPQVKTIESTQVGAFAQGRFEFDSGIDLSTGLRLDHHRYTDWKGATFTDTGASVNGTLSYRVTEGAEVFVGASRTWLGFDYGEYGLLHARNAAFMTDPAFAPATAKNVKAGVNLSQDNWTGTMTFFDTRLEGLGTYDTTAGFLRNGGKARSRGVTLNGAYSWGSGRVGASFTKARLTRDGDTALADGGTLMPIGNVAALYIDQDIPSWNMKVGATVEWAGKLEDAYMTANGYKAHPSYTVVNAYAEWTPPATPNLSLRLGVDNLFDEEYYERSSYIERDMGSRYVYPVYAPGRTVTLGLKLNF